MHDEEESEDGYRHNGSKIFLVDIKEVTMCDVQAKQLVKLTRDGVTRKFVVDDGLIRTRCGNIFVPKWGNLLEEVMT